MNHPAQNYIATIPTPYQGGRNETLNRAAYQIRERFSDLSQHEYEDLLLTWVNSWPSPLPDAEATKTIQSAWNGAASKGTVGTKAKTKVSVPYQPQARPAAMPVKAANYSKPEDRNLPDPIPDGTRKLLTLAFHSTEGIRISDADINEDRRETPNAGVVLSRDEWLAKLSRFDGDPNGIFSSSERTGIYIGINPMKVGGKSDADVTSYRHALLEFDEISKEEQWHVIRESRVPCTAVIDSGGKSIHAWVRIDARDYKEYSERVATLYQHFQNYSPDLANKNPSRFSRLPNCIRFAKRQELIATSMGAEDWLQWSSELALEGEPEPLRVKQLLEYSRQEDPHNVIGKRYLCRGGSVLLVGQSGIGKSSLTAQFAISWACGQGLFGIRPVCPLKIMVIQAENDDGDLAEMTAGVLGGMWLDEDSKDFETINQNLIFIRDTVETGFAFTEKVRRLVTRHRPDVVFLDPLLSFIGADISKQEVCSQFLRNWLNPISEESGCIWFCIHHTGKPANDPKSRSGWTDNDWAYAGMGSSELTNWARAVMVLRNVAPGHFKLTLAKRGPRAGAVHLDGTPTTSVWLKHADEGICWEQIPEPIELQEEELPTPVKSKGRPSVEVDLGLVIDSLTEPISKNKLCERISDFAESKGVVIRRTAAQQRIATLVKNKAILKTDEGYIKA